MEAAVVDQLITVVTTGPAVTKVMACHAAVVAGAEEADHSDVGDAGAGNTKMEIERTAETADLRIPSKSNLMVPRKTPQPRPTIDW